MNSMWFEYDDEKFILSLNTILIILIRRRHVKLIINGFFSEKIEYWLTSISSFSKRDNEGNTHVVVPPIIMIGSKLDKVNAVSISINYNIQIA